MYTSCMYGVFKKTHFKHTAFTPVCPILVHVLGAKRRSGANLVNLSPSFYFYSSIAIYIYIYKTWAESVLLLYLYGFSIPLHSSLQEKIYIKNSVFKF